jgi:aminodeoxyfutalosine synthase
MQLEQNFDKLRSRAHQPLTEVHVRQRPPSRSAVFVLHGHVSGMKAIRPGHPLKCFTAVEIAFFAETYGMTDEQVLRELMAAGLDSLPGGGAEIFCRRVRKKICPRQGDADRYLSIHRLAHRLGMRSNVTMLYGHIETMEERVDHMMRARALQDETAGSRRSIPARVSSRQQPDAKLARRRLASDTCACTRCAPDAATTSRSSRGVLDLRPGVVDCAMALWFARRS